jgi:hypothetical protein
MNLFKFINIPIFLLSLVFGLFAVYITMPDTRTILVYPTPENIDLIQYRDKTGSCFHYKQNEIDCPTNASDISKIPTQS